MKIKTLISGLLLSVATFVQLASAQQPGKVPSHRISFGYQ
jgi:hypothetical protein